MATDRDRAVFGGVVAGFVGGLGLSVFMAATTAAKGGDVWQAMKGAGAPFLREAAMRPGFDAGPVTVGLLSHFAVSIGWGILFGALFYGLPRAATLLAGVLWGIVVWVAMFYVVLPVFGLGEMVAQVPVSAAILEHVLFGVLVAVGFLPFQRRIGGRVPAAPA